MLPDRVPAFRELGGTPGRPPQSSWGVFGDDDQVGTLNFQTDERRAAAARLIRLGRAYPLNWDVEQPAPALFGRQVLRHRLIQLDPVGTEDVYDDFYPQASSQWDALAHIKHPVHGYYNHCSPEQVTGLPGSRNGIEHWAQRGIAGRFVLADVARWREHVGRPIDHDASDAVPVDEIDECLRYQRVDLHPGDVLLLRFGWVAWYEQTGATTRQELAATEEFPCPGLANEERTAEWIWDHQLAAVGGDNPALECMPFDESRPDGFLHYRLIPLLGLAIAEMLFLEELADACAGDGVYEGFFTAAPVNKTGGSGSPANALAVR